MRKKILNFFTLNLINAALSLSLMPVLTFILSDYNQAKGDPREAPGLPIARLALPSLPGSTNFVSSTGTNVGSKVIEFNSMIREIEGHAAIIIQSTRTLYEKAIAEVNQYYLSTSEIEAKLQLGTTPGNPTLITLRNKAEEQLNQIMNTISGMDELANDFLQNSDQIRILSLNIEDALQIPGAVDEDHAHLILMSDELAKAQRAITQTLDILNANAKRQNEWLALERSHFTNLSLSIDKGKILVSHLGQTASYPLPIALPEINTFEEKQSELRKEVVHSHKISKSPLPLAKKISVTNEELSELPQRKTVDHKLLSSPVKAAELVKQQKRQLHTEKTEISKTFSSDEKPLPVVAISSRQEVNPLPEVETPSPTQEQTLPPQGMISLSTVSGGRSPIGVVDGNQDIYGQKWYIFSTVKRSLKDSSNIVEIVNVVKGNERNPRGEEIKNILVEMGINSNQIRVLNATDEGNHAGQTLIFK